MPGFLGVERLSLGSWQAFERALQRLLLHAGFKDVRLVGGAGDAGADVVGEHAGKLWVAQAKYRGGGQLIGPGVVDEVTTAIGRYDAQVALIAVNTGFTEEAVNAARKRSGDLGVPIYLWNHDAIEDRVDALPSHAERRHEPRPYQAEAIAAINAQIMQGARRGLLLMATGLGKTRVAAGVIEQWVADHPGDEVLVVVPSLALAPQLESEFWPYLRKSIPTHLLTGSEKPAFEGGVTIATQQSMARIGVDARGRYGLVVVDEAHHAPADGVKAMLDKLKPSYLLGMTATPWRGDNRQLTELFGDPVYSASIVEGMQHGYLAQVEYRMLVDDIDWDWVQSQLGSSVSVRELNRRLFVPERDEAIITAITGQLLAMDDPRCIAFCRSIDHAERVGRLLQANDVKCRVLHSRLDRFEATATLRGFRSGEVPVVVTVDMLNEGIDVPDVDLIVFLRVTHSRRIFLQQLGRGLRLAEGKSSVTVIDFVSDIRRIAAGIELNREARAVADRPGADVLYETGAVVSFNDDRAATFVDEYLADVANLDDADDEARLQFPSTT